MKFLLPFALCIALTPNAHAWKLGEPLGKLVEDTAKDVETGVQNIGKAAEDIVTLGEAGRRRDKEAAEHEKQKAELQRQQAEQLLREKIKQIDQQIAVAKQSIVSSESYLESFKLLKQSIETNLKTTDLLAQAISSHALEYSTFRELIAIQQADLVKWVGHLNDLNKSAQKPSGSALANAPSALSEKLALYAEQIDSIPRNEFDVSNDQFIVQALEAGFEALSLLQINIERTAKDLQSAKALIPALESERAKLK